MAGKNGDGDDLKQSQIQGDPSPETIEDEDIDEYLNLNNTIDNLNNCLDSIEEKNDDLTNKLKELLESNKQIRAEITKDDGDEGEKQEEQSQS